MTRLLVTGGTGFVGSACVRAALARGHEVHVLARETRHVPAGVSVHRWDLLGDSPRDLLAEVRPTHLAHLAWIATPGVYWTSPENQLWVEASRELVGAFADAGGQRALVAGTCAEYDWTGDGRFDERETPLRPATPYGRAKNELGKALVKLCNERGIGLAWARLFFLYGPGEHPDRLVPYVIRQLLNGEPALCTEGNHRRDFLHVDDAADALLALLESEVGGAVNVASGAPVEVRTVIQSVADICDRPDLVRLGARAAGANDPELIVGEVTRLSAEVGWTPRIALDEGLLATVDWWKEHDDSPGE